MDSTRARIPANAGSLAVEIAVQSVEGARVAREHGATRVELCQGLVLGGLTPSVGSVSVAVADARAAGAQDVHVLIRPRPGDFVFSRSDRYVMERDIDEFGRLGAAGVVIGALTEDGSLDRPIIESLIHAAGDLTVTFHRAIDIALGGASLVSELAELGVHRILTSGGATSSADGLDVLAGFVRESAGRVEIMAGGGVTIEAIPALASIGVDAVHLSARAAAGRTFGSGPGGGDDGHDVTDPDLVARAVAAARESTYAPKNP
ncbi:MAG: copper homeostasis protein CutC [Leifsonia flava]